MLIQYREEVRDRVAQTLIHMWPFLYMVVENLKQ